MDSLGRARRSGTAGFVPVGNLFAGEKERRFGIDLRSDIDRQDAAAAVQVLAFRSGVLVGGGKDAQAKDD
jgi:hypothetical protein